MFFICFTFVLFIPFCNQHSVIFNNFLLSSSIQFFKIDEFHFEYYVIKHFPVIWKTAVIFTRCSTCCFIAGFFTLTVNQAVISINEVLWSGCSVCYFVICAVLFLWPKRLRHISQGNLVNMVPDVRLTPRMWCTYLQTIILYRKHLTYTICFVIYGSFPKPYLSKIMSIG